jgi:hypothetical protein
MTKLYESSTGDITLLHTDGGGQVVRAVRGVEVMPEGSGIEVMVYQDAITAEDGFDVHDEESAQAVADEVHRYDKMIGEYNEGTYIANIYLDQMGASGQRLFGVPDENDANSAKETQ